MTAAPVSARTASLSPSASSGNVGKPNTSQSQPAGRARQASVASVTTASVPSDPTRSRRRSGPAAERGTGRHRRMPPSGQDRGAAQQHVLDGPESGGRLPAEEAAIQPPTVEDRDRLRIVAGRQPVTRPGRPRAGRRARPRRWTTRDTRSTAMTRVHPGQVQHDRSGLRPRRTPRSRRPAGSRRRALRRPRPAPWRPLRCGPGRRPRPGSEGRRPGHAAAAPAPRSRWPGPAGGRASVVTAPAGRRPAKVSIGSTARIVAQPRRHRPLSTAVRTGRFVRRCRSAGPGRRQAARRRPTGTPGSRHRVPGG